MVVVKSRSAQHIEYRQAPYCNRQGLYTKMTGKPEHQIYYQVDNDGPDIESITNKQDQPELAEGNRFYGMQDEQVHWFGMYGVMV